MNLFPRSVRIKKIKRETPLVQSYTFEYPDRASPGQFINVWLPGVDEKPMSVAFDDGKNITVSVAAIGTLTIALAEKKEGDVVGVRGPFGTRFTWKPKMRIAMLAGGYGVAPLYFAAHEAVKDGCTVDFFHGARTKDHLPLMDRVKRLSRTHYYPATNDGSLGFQGTNVQCWLNHMKTRARRQKNKSLPPYDVVFTCGPESMMKMVSDICTQSKISAQISVERYMKCGFGICGNCVVDDLGITTCQKGTVMDNKIVRTIKEFGLYHRDSLGKKHEW